MCFVKAAALLPPTLITMDERLFLAGWPQGQAILQVLIPPICSSGTYCTSFQVYVAGPRSVYPAAQLIAITHPRVPKVKSAQKLRPPFNIGTLLVASHTLSGAIYQDNPLMTIDHSPAAEQSLGRAHTE